MAASRIESVGTMLDKCNQNYIGIKNVPGLWQLLLAGWFAVCLVACGRNSQLSSTVTSVSASCMPASIQTGKTSNCVALVSGAGRFDSSVTWSTSNGTISATGQLTAPSSVPNPATVTTSTGRNAYTE